MHQLCLPLGERCSLGRAFTWMLEQIECKPATLHMHLAHVRYLIRGTAKRGGIHRPGIGDVDVRTLGYPEVMEWFRRERLHGVSKETLKKRLCTLRLAMLAAVEHRALERLPQWPEIRTDTVRGEAFWTLEEFNKAIESCDDEDMAAWITVGWWTGLRASDIDDFRWDDVDLAKGLWVRRASKTGVAPMKLPLPAPFRKWLEAHRRRQCPHPRDLVCGQRQGHPNAFLRQLCNRAGVTVISTKGLRHSCETHLYATGADVATQIAWLGLTSERMLRVYRHPSGELIDRAAKAAGRKPARKKFSARIPNGSAGLA